MRAATGSFSHSAQRRDASAIVNERKVKCSLAKARSILPRCTAIERPLRRDGREPVVYAQTQGAEPRIALLAVVFLVAIVGIEIFKLHRHTGRQCDLMPAPAVQPKCVALALSTSPPVNSTLSFHCDTAKP